MSYTKLMVRGHKEGFNKGQESAHGKTVGKTSILRFQEVSLQKVIF